MKERKKRKRGEGKENRGTGENGREMEEERRR